MSTLTGKQTAKLNDALDDAFDSVDALDDFLWEMLDKKLQNLAIASGTLTVEGGPTVPLPPSPSAIARADVGTITRTSLV